MGLWGIPDRAIAWAFFWFSLFLAVVPTVRAYFTGDTQHFLCGLFGLAALWYWLCIRWVDEHGGWS